MDKTKVLVASKSAPSIPHAASSSQVPLLGSPAGVSSASPGTTQSVLSPQLPSARSWDSLAPLSPGSPSSSAYSSFHSPFSPTPPASPLDAAGAHGGGGGGSSESGSATSWRYRRKGYLQKKHKLRQSLTTITVDVPSGTAGTSAQVPPSTSPLSPSAYSSGLSPVSPMGSIGPSSAPPSPRPTSASPSHAVDLTAATLPRADSTRSLAQSTTSGIDADIEDDDVEDVGAGTTSSSLPKKRWARPRLKLGTEEEANQAGALSADAQTKPKESPNKKKKKKRKSRRWIRPSLAVKGDDGKDADPEVQASDTKAAAQPGGGKGRWKRPGLVVTVEQEEARREEPHSRNSDLESGVAVQDTAGGLQQQQAYPCELEKSWELTSDMQFRTKEYTITQQGMTQSPALAQLKQFHVQQKHLERRSQERRARRVARGRAGGGSHRLAPRTPPRHRRQYSSSVVMDVRQDLQALAIAAARAAAAAEDSESTDTDRGGTGPRLGMVGMKRAVSDENLPLGLDMHVHAANRAKGALKRRELPLSTHEVLPQPAGANTAPDSGTDSQAELVRHKFSAKDLLYLGRLGQGASGFVVRALHLPTFQLVALKKIDVFQRDRRHQMLKEMRALESLYHDNIVSLFGAFFHQARLTMVLEYMDRGCLDGLVREYGALSPALLAHVARDACLGLAYIHKKRLVHRDIKPANLLINRMGQTKIGDLGIVEHLNEKDQAESFTGTMLYMSPERIEAKPYGTPADIWSLGLSILACATGKPPYSDRPSSSKAQRQAQPQPQGSPNSAGAGGVPQPANGTSGASAYWDLLLRVSKEPPPALGPEFPEDLRDFVKCCLHKKAEDRWTAEQLLEHEFVKHISATLSSPLPTLKNVHTSPEVKEHSLARSQTAASMALSSCCWPNEAQKRTELIQQVGKIMKTLVQKVYMRRPEERQHFYQKLPATDSTGDANTSAVPLAPIAPTASQSFAPDHSSSAQRVSITKQQRARFQLLAYQLGVPFHDVVAEFHRSLSKELDRRLESKFRTL